MIYIYVFRLSFAIKTTLKAHLIQYMIFILSIYVSLPASEVWEFTELYMHNSCGTVTACLKVNFNCSPTC
jgi:hypothetical protein